MEGVEFHSALEGICGDGKNFLLERFEEGRMFMKAESIDSTQTTWVELYQSMQEIGTR